MNPALLPCNVSGIHPSGRTSYVVISQTNDGPVLGCTFAQARQLAHDLLAAVGDDDAPVVGGILGGHGWSVDRSGSPLVLDSDGCCIARADSHTAAWRLAEAHNASLTSVLPPAPPITAPYSAPWEIRHNCGCPLIYDHNRTLIARFDDSATAYAVFDAHNRTSNVVPPVPAASTAAKHWIQGSSGQNCNCIYTSEGVLVSAIHSGHAAETVVRAHNDAIGYTPPAKDWVLEAAREVIENMRNNGTALGELASIIRKHAPATS